MVLSVLVKFATKYLLQIRSKRTRPNVSLQRTEMVAMELSKPVEIMKSAFECRIGRLAGCSRSAILMNPYLAIPLCQE
jgi:hypothetical protein